MGATFFDALRPVLGAVLSRGLSRNGTEFGVEIVLIGKTHDGCDLLDGVIRIFQQLAGAGNPQAVLIVDRGNTHKSLESVRKTAGAQVTHFCQFL